MANTLLILTSANQSFYTCNALDSLFRFGPKKWLDVVLIDDASKDRTRAIVTTRFPKVRFISKPKPKGLTHSWNLGYNLFRSGNYRNAIICNNDVVFGRTSLEHLRNAIEKSRGIVGPLTTFKGQGNGKHQNVLDYYPFLKRSSLAEANQIQGRIGGSTRLKKVDYVNGFCFGFDRSIIQYEIRPGILFNPSNTNIHNEVELQARVPLSKFVLLSSFIFHYKGVSFKGRHKLNRQKLWNQV